MGVRDHLQDLYRARFDERERHNLAVTWRALCRHYLQRWVPEDGVVLDLAAGEGNFIRNIRARRRIALDVNPDVRRLEEEGIEVCVCPADEVGERFAGELDVLFTSNFFEHLRSKDEMLELLASCRRALRSGGRILVLQPNVRYVGGAYWDYFDHHLPLTDKSLGEALTLAGLEVEELVPRFLPYTAKSRLGGLAPLTALYVRVPLLWRVFGKQAFAVARAP